jgi:chromosome segregation ATPase
MSDPTPTTPTPRTRALLDRISNDIKYKAPEQATDALNCYMAKLRDHGLQLETELTEAKAALTASTERLALELREAKAERDALERDLENKSEDYDAVCSQLKEYVDAMPLQVERDFEQRDEIKRLRALAGELAGALERARLHTYNAFGTPTTTTDSIDCALARYREALKE